MNNFKKLLLLTLLVAVLFAGCIDVKTYQKFGRDGSSTVTESIDYSTLAQMASSMNGSNSMGNPCANVTTPGISCAYADNVVNLTKTITAADAASAYDFKVERGFPYITYKLTVDKVPFFSGSKASDNSTAGVEQSLSGSLTDPSAKQSAASLETIKMTISYEVQMPGSVTRADNSETFIDDWAKYDLLSLMKEGKNVYVESQELNVEHVSYAVIIVVVVLFGLALLVWSRMRKPARRK